MVLRSFAREVNLSGNYELELRDQEAIEWAVGQYLDSLRRNPDSRRTRDNVEWITDFLLERLRDGKAVNLFNRNSELFQYLVKFIREVSDETYMLNKEPMSRYFADPDNIRNLRNHLMMATKAALRHISDIGKEATGYIGQRTGLKGFKLSKTAEKMFLKAIDIENELASLAKSKTLQKAINDPECLFNSGNTDSEAVDFLGGCCHRIAGNISQLHLVRAISSRTFYMGIIGEINGFIEQFRKENNTLLISDTNTLLNEIMEGSDAPFIYERVGVRLRHFLIDEFQDTSKMQWKNLRPLILNGLSELNDSLIIGDEKQCIYRFRNSDPTLLQSAVQKEFHDSIDLDKIENAKNTNWRSSLEVIEFNNALFDPKSSAMSREFGTIYAKARQNMPMKKQPRRGYVSVTSVSGLKERKQMVMACFENMA